VVLVTDDDQTETFFAVWGSVSEKTNVILSMSPEQSQYLTNIGVLDAARLGALRRALSIHLYAFIPEPASWTPQTISPCLISESLVVIMGEQVGWSLGGLSECHSDRRDTEVKFERKKWWLFERWTMTQIRTGTTLPNQFLRDFLVARKQEIEKTWSNEPYPAFPI
jgi:hypothetical protein